jgi:hypothetical protein
LVFGRRRFRGHRRVYRADRPEERPRRAVRELPERGNHPAYDNHGNLGATSRNARKLINAIEAGKTVTVSVLDDPALAGKTNAWRNELETDLIRYQLCQSGVEVWNVAKVVAAREVRVLTVIRPDPAGQAAHEAAFQLIPEELRQGLRRITDAIPMFKHDFERLAVEIFDAGRDLGHDEASDEVEEYRRAMQPCELEHPGAAL